MPKKTKRTSTTWILGDQLSPSALSLSDTDRTQSVVFMAESFSRANKLPYHKQKLVLVWSAMRHFAEELREAGYDVDYYEAQPNLRKALQAHRKTYKTRRLRLMESAEYGVSTRLAEMARMEGFEVELMPNNLFSSDKEEFARDARGKKTLLMESFYRKMRRKTSLLIDEDQPVGGKWNYDRENRQRPPRGHRFPEVPCFEPDETTRKVIDLVRSRFDDHWGSLDTFSWPVTRADAERFLDDFLDNRLDLFGPYEDAIVSGETTLYHSRLSPLFNLGLLEPLEACRAAEERYHEKRARINSVEGFIRQIIGWREFVYQVYHLKMPSYIEGNYLDADLPLPDFYWSGKTRMHCVADAVGTLQNHGINHHIQRLMITGNFALIAGIDPREVNRWYELAYVDAYEWVVTPNVLGLALFADGGVLATKPYAASANYIHKMSDHCEACTYDRRKTTGEEACPFNSLYWDFLTRNRRRFEKNARMNLVMALLSKKKPDELASIRKRASKVRSRVSGGEEI
jgi:deoxyribodipyrimidine photolyase-related protein